MLRFRYADSSFGQIHFATAGSGPKLLLLPGSTRSYRQFLPFVPMLAPHFEVIAMDTLGYGASGPFPAGGTIQSIATSTAEVLDFLGAERVHVFGMHTGHKVGAALAARHPERVDRLIVAGKTHSLIPDQPRRNSAILSRLGSHAGINLAVSPVGKLAWLRTFKGVSGLWWNERLLEANGAELVASIRNKIVDELTSLECTGPIYHANFEFDFAEALAAVTSPTLIIEVTHPSEDRAYGRQAQKLVDIMQNAKLVELPSVDEVGLACNAETADMATCIMQFLA